MAFMTPASIAVIFNIALCINALFHNENTPVFIIGIPTLFLIFITKSSDRKAK
jgi:hypothetical protein